MDALKSPLGLRSALPWFQELLTSIASTQDLLKITLAQLSLLKSGNVTLQSCPLLPARGDRARADSPAPLGGYRPGRGAGCSLLPAPAHAVPAPASEVVLMRFGMDFPC